MGSPSRRGLPKPDDHPTALHRDRLLPPTKTDTSSSITHASPEHGGHGRPTYPVFIVLTALLCRPMALQTHANSVVVADVSLSMGPATSYSSGAACMLAS